ncbi:MAG: sensor histidine kinase [Treponema sp.]
MKKILFPFFLFLLINTEVFCHEQKMQEESLEPETVTKIWKECENIAGNKNSIKDKNNGGAEIQFSEEYLNLLTACCTEIENSKPDGTVLYYFPEAADIYEKLCQASAKLLELAKNDESDLQEYESLCRQMNESLCDWEILQKNLAQFQSRRISYSYRILIAAIIVLILVLIVFFLMYLVTSKSRDENQAFAIQMQMAQEDERERISNELHDTVCQDLRVLQFQIEDKQSVKLCKKIASDVRNYCYALTPSDLSEGILEALISLCVMTKQTSGQNIILSIQDDIKSNPAIKDFSKDKSLNIYRIVQEILNNAANHSESETISVLVRSFDSNRFKIIVSDEGKGFDLKSALKKKNHFGLKNIYRRAQSIHAEISINSAPGEGTQTTVIIPYK